MCRIADRVDVDLVVMDVSFANSSYDGTRMDGLGMSRFLKTDPPTRHISILLATTHAMKAHRESLLERSMVDDDASKPITEPQELIDEVKALLARSEPG